MRKSFHWELQPVALLANVFTQDNCFLLQSNENPANHGKRSKKLGHSAPEANKIEKYVSSLLVSSDKDDQAYNRRGMQSREQVLLAALCNQLYQCIVTGGIFTW